MSKAVGPRMTPAREFAQDSRLAQTGTEEAAHLCSYQDDGKEKNKL